MYTSIYLSSYMYMWEGRGAQAQGRARLHAQHDPGLLLYVMVVYQYLSGLYIILIIRVMLWLIMFIRVMLCLFIRVYIILH